VLKVPNAALRFRPATTAAATPAATTTPQQPQQRGSRQGGTRMGTLYYLDTQGKLATLRVRTGITDGTTTEVEGTNVKEGMRVIAGTAVQTAETTSATPFQGNQQQQRGPRGGF